MRAPEMDYKEAWGGGGGGEGEKGRKLGSPSHHAIVPAFVALMMWMVQKLKL